MCAEYTTKTSVKDIENKLSLKIESNLEAQRWDEHIRLYASTPVLIKKSGKYRLEEMKFSLKPRGTPYPTFNARLLSWDEKKKEIIPIYEKPTWKKPFQKQRCLIPMSGFVEPVYLNEFAGKMMEFNQRSGEPMYCAGLFDETIDKKTGEVYQGVSLILSTPSAYVHKIGHHRQPVFIHPKLAPSWLKEEDMNFQDGMDLLTKENDQPDLEASTFRQMAKGWEKRIPESEKKFKQESEFMKRLGKHG